MYIELLEDEYDKIKEVSKITLTDYDLKGNLISVDSLLSALEDMLCEYRTKEEEIENLEEDLRENYRRIPVSEQVGISDKDFI